jgi:hypothetical protein
MKSHFAQFFAVSALTAMGFMLTGCQQTPPPSTTTVVPGPAGAPGAPGPTGAPADTPAPTPTTTTESTSRSRTTEVTPDPSNPDVSKKTVTRDSTTVKQTQ